MANMTIRTINNDYKGISFDETHYLRYEHHADMDMGTSDFSMGLILYADSTMANKGTYKYLISKNDGDFANDTGYLLDYDATNERILFYINDGDVTASLAYTSNSSFIDDTWHYIWVNVDRDVGTTFYKNGSLITTASDNTTNASGSCSKTIPLWIGAYPANPNSFFKGYMSGIHLCKGFLPSATWIEEWYYRMKYFYPRNPPKQKSITWKFNSTLDAVEIYSYDSNYTHNGEYCPSGTPTYSIYQPNEVIYTFNRNPQYGFEQGYLPLDVTSRAKDGTLKYYQKGTKKRLFLSFISNSKEQRYFVEGAWVSRTPLTVKLDSDEHIELTGYMTSPPIPLEIAPDIFQYDIEIEEI